MVVQSFKGHIQLLLSALNKQSGKSNLNAYSTEVLIGWLENKDPLRPQNLKMKTPQFSLLFLLNCIF